MNGSTNWFFKNLNGFFRHAKTTFAWPNIDRTIYQVNTICPKATKNNKIFFNLSQKIF